MEIEWKPKSGYMYELPSGKQGFMPMPKLRFTLNKYGVDIVIQRVRVKVQKGAREMRKSLGLPGMTHHESWAIGRLNADGGFEKARSLTQSEAVAELTRLSGELPERIRDIIESAV